MATLLVFVLTDARLSPALARRILLDGVDGTLNAITVDGDKSTNDTVLLLASGVARNLAIAPGTADHRRLGGAVTDALAEVARLVVLDGEGSTRAVDVVVRGARSDADAALMARAIGNSPLCKAAFHGGDPNWGRFVMAAGMVDAPLDADRVDVRIGGVLVARRGRPIPGSLPRAARRMRGPEFSIEIDLHLGRGAGRILAADLSVAYVRFNAEYTT